MNGKSQAHRIRLAGPWQNERGTLPSCRVTLPFRSEDLTEGRCVSRAFNGSQGMLAAATVCVQITFEGHPPKVDLNQQRLTPLPMTPQTADPTAEAAPNELILDVTSLLARSNSLVLEFEAEKHSVVTEVSLLIYETPVRS